MRRTVKLPTLRDAIAAHLAWKNKVRDFLVGLNTEEPEFRDHTQCILGKWILSESSGPYREQCQEHFAELEAHHEELHNSVKLILQERRNRNIKVAESEFRRLEALSNLVVAKIELIDQVFEMREYDNGLAVTAEYLGRLKKSGFQKLEVFQDCGVVDIPYHIVSGDFYWSGKKDAKTYVVLGDAVGNGSSAALVSTAFLTVVDGMFNAFPRNTLVDFAQRTHDYFRENIVEAISSDHISVDFTFVVYDADAHKLRVVAKRQKALLRLGGTWQELKADRNTERMEDLLMEFDFAPGDMVVLYSDGVPSLQTDAEGTKLNQKGVLQFLEDFDGLKASKLSQQFEKMALDYRERFGQVDDVTFIALQL